MIPSSQQKQQQIRYYNLYFCRNRIFCIVVVMTMIMTQIYPNSSLYRKIWGRSGSIVEAFIASYSHNTAIYHKAIGRTQNTYRTVSSVHSNVPQKYTNSNVPTNNNSNSTFHLQLDRIRSPNINQNKDRPDPIIDGGGYGRPVVQWYPGHIAKAERALATTMKSVDVIIEVRDARIPSATSHPSVGTQWCQNKPRIIVLTHVDAIPRIALSAWHNTLLQSNDLVVNDDAIQRDLYHYHRRKLGSAESSDIQNSIISTASPTSTVVNNPNSLIQQRAAQVESVRVKYNPSSSSSIKPSTATKSNKKSTSSSTTTAYKPASDVIFVNAKIGTGIHKLSRAIHNAGQYIQEKRSNRGLMNRSIRVGVLGYPNVGKSALINKLLGKKRCPTANVPGVTRNVQWIRVKSDRTSSSSGSSNSKRVNDFDLLDSPGIIPAILADQSDAMLLAACHCIGEASYDNQAVASYLCEWILAVHALGYQKQVAPHWRNKCIDRYKFDPIISIPNKPIKMQDGSNLGQFKNQNRLTGEDMLYLVADNTCQGNPEDASRKILQDFRAGRMGPICLQVAPTSTTVSSSSSLPNINMKNTTTNNNPDDIVWQIQKQQREQIQQDRSRDAFAIAKARGLELPPLSRNSQSSNSTSASPTDNVTGPGEDPLAPSVIATSKTIIGKGLFEGW